MKQIVLLAVVLPITLGLICSTYDYSQPTVKCTTVCPSGTTLIGTNCLTASQYQLNSQILTCTGYVSADRSVCCPLGFYLQNNLCLRCRGQIFNNGFACCTADSYLDLTQDAPNCVPLSTGACPALGLSSIAKVCCQGNKFYHMALKQCIDPSGYNCDNVERICCGAAQRM